MPNMDWTNPDLNALNNLWSYVFQFSFWFGLICTSLLNTEGIRVFQKGFRNHHLEAPLAYLKNIQQFVIFMLKWHDGSSWDIHEWKTEFSISDIKWGALLFGMKCYSIMTQPKTILQPQKSLPHDVTFKTANWSSFSFWSSNETWLCCRSGHKPQFFRPCILNSWAMRTFF